MLSAEMKSAREPTRAPGQGAAVPSTGEATRAEPAVCGGRTRGGGGSWRLWSWRRGGASAAGRGGRGGGGRNTGQNATEPGPRCPETHASGRCRRGTRMPQRRGTPSSRVPRARAVCARASGPAGGGLRIPGCIPRHVQSRSRDCRRRRRRTREHPVGRSAWRCPQRLSAQSCDGQVSRGMSRECAPGRLQCFCVRRRRALASRRPRRNPRPCPSPWRLRPT